MLLPHWGSMIWWINLNSCILDMHDIKPLGIHCIIRTTDQTTIELFFIFMPSIRKCSYIYKCSTLVVTLAGCWTNDPPDMLFNLSVTVLDRSLGMEHLWCANTAWSYYHKIIFHNTCIVVFKFDLFSST